MRRTLLSFLLALSLFTTCTLAGFLCTMSAWAAGKETYAAWDTLARAFHEIQSRYVEPVDPAKLVYAALEGVTAALDPHSAFLDPTAYAEQREADRDRYWGLGVRVAAHPRGLRITEVLPESPAHIADLQPGDLILTVDGLALTGVPFEVAAGRLDGPRGAALRLGVEHQGRADERTVARDLIRVPAADADLVAPGCGYVAIVHFQEGAAAEFKAALSALQQKNGGPLDQLVLDLRDNPGGLLDEAVQIVDVFVGDVLIVETRGRDPGEAERHRGTVSQQDLAVSPIVLVNGGSASASEIVAGTLRALGRATLVGTATYGKGSVQAIWEFEDDSALKLSVARYHLADGTPIDHRAGLTPDVPVASAEQERLAILLAELSERVQAAGPELRPVDRGALERALEQVERTAPDPDPGRPWGVPVQARAASDPQLARALALAGLPGADPRQRE